MPPWTAPGSAGADTTRQPASPLVNLTGRDLVGDAEEGDLGRVRRQARRPRSARPTGSAVMLSSLPEAGSTALATHTSISQPGAALELVTGLEFPLRALAQNQSHVTVGGCGRVARPRPPVEPVSETAIPVNSTWVGQ